MRCLLLVLFLAGGCKTRLLEFAFSPFDGSPDAGDLAANSSPPLPLWPLPGGSAENRFSSGVKGPSGSTERWSAAQRGHPLVGADGTIYLLEARALGAIDLANGQLQWSAPVSTNARPGLAALGRDGTIFVADSERFLPFGTRFEVAAHEPGGGAERWKLALGTEQGMDAAVVADDGTLLVAAGKQTIYAIHPNGTLRWSRPTFLGTYVALAFRGSTVFAAGDGRLVALDLADGHSLWETKAAHYFVAGPAVGNGDSVYLAERDRLVAHSINNGQLLWEMGFPDQVMELAVGPDDSLYLSGIVRLDHYSPSGALLW